MMEQLPCEAALTLLVNTSPAAAQTNIVPEVISDYPDIQCISTTGLDLCASQLPSGWILIKSNESCHLLQFE